MNELTKGECCKQFIEATITTTPEMRIILADIPINAYKIISKTLELTILYCIYPFL